MKRALVIALLLASCGSPAAPPSAGVSDPPTTLHLPLVLTPPPNDTKTTKTIYKVTAKINEVAEMELIAVGPSGVLVQHVCGTATSTEIHISTCASTDDESVEVVLVHEIGHVLGLDHSENIKSVMYKWYQVMTLGDAARSLIVEISLHWDAIVQ